MMSSLMGRRRGKAPTRDRGGDRNTARSSGRALEGLDFIEGLAGPGPGGEKFVAHKEWTKEPFADDFDDEDLE
ncbi:unnamed protein product [Ectocarpus sp. 12 AP-2014]